MSGEGWGLQGAIEAARASTETKVWAAASNDFLGVEVFTRNLAGRV